MSMKRPITPGWMALGVLIAVLTAAFIRLGFWQTDRRAETIESNEILAARLAGDPVPIDALLIPDVEQDPEDLIGWPVEVEGTFLPDEQVLIRGRSHNRTPGAWVITPLARVQGPVVAVNRGWVPLEITEPHDPRIDPPQGVVTVAGITIPGEIPTALGPKEPTEGHLDVLTNLDLERIGQQVGADLGPILIQMRGTAEQPPIPLDPPGDDDPATNTGYAIQWFGFAAVVVIGYVALVGRQLGRGPLARRKPSRQTGEHADV